MKPILVLLLTFAINTNVMAQEPATPAPVLPAGRSMPSTAESPNSPEDKALVDQDHKPESGTLEQHADKKKFKKNKKKNSKTKHHGAHNKHRKNKKTHA